MSSTYAKYEALRLVRNKRAFIFSLIFPLALFLVIGVSNKDQRFDEAGGIDGLTYYMVSMAGYGAMIAAVSGGARIAAERTVGWNRQLRLTPLRVSTYFRTKVATSYLMASVSIVLLYASGIAFGVRLSPVSRWVEMTALILVALLPFIGLGIFAGHLVSTDSMGPVIGGGSAFFGFLGGQWYPLPAGSVLRTIGEWIPSFWLVQSRNAGLGLGSWSAKGWIVIGLWSVGAALAAGCAYRRDTKRVA